MYYNFKVNASSPHLQDFAACRALAPAPVSAFRKSWGMPLRTGILPEDLLVIMAFSPAAAGPPGGGELLPVAYSFNTPTRLGHSPKGVFDRAYHNMTAKAESKTYFGLDKKSGPATRLAPKPPYLHSRSPVMTVRSAIFEPSGAIPRNQINDNKALLIS